MAKFGAAKFGEAQFGVETGQEVATEQATITTAPASTAEEAVAPAAMTVGDIRPSGNFPVAEPEAMTARVGVVLDEQAFAHPDRERLRVSDVGTAQANGELGDPAAMTMTATVAMSSTPLVEPYGPDLNEGTDPIYEEPYPGETPPAFDQSTGTAPPSRTSMTISPVDAFTPTVRVSDEFGNPERMTLWASTQARDDVEHAVTASASIRDRPPMEPATEFHAVGDARVRDGAALVDVEEGHAEPLRVTAHTAEARYATVLQQTARVRDQEVLTADVEVLQQPVRVSDAESESNKPPAGSAVVMPRASNVPIPAEPAGAAVVTVSPYEVRFAQRMGVLFAKLGGVGDLTMTRVGPRTSQYGEQGVEF